MSDEPVYCIGDRVIFPDLCKTAQYMLVDNGSDWSYNEAVGLVELSSGRMQRMSPSLAPEPPHKWVPVANMFKITHAELDIISGGDRFVRVSVSAIPARIRNTTMAMASSGTYAESLDAIDTEQEKT